VLIQDCTPTINRLWHRVVHTMNPSTDSRLFQGSIHVVTQTAVAPMDVTSALVQSQATFPPCASRAAMTGTSEALSVSSRAPAHRSGTTSGCFKTDVNTSTAAALDAADIAMPVLPKLLTTDKPSGHLDPCRHSLYGVPVIREWMMPSPSTFRIACIRDLLSYYLPLDPNSSAGSELIVVDPFCGVSGNEFATRQYTNDLNPTAATQHHLHAPEFLRMLISQGVRADAVLLDPPYSGKQIEICYKGVGKAVSRTLEENMRLYDECKDLIDRIVKPRGLVITFGWNSRGMGRSRGFFKEAIMTVAHGGAHNDTVVVVERKRRVSQQHVDARSVVHPVVRVSLIVLTGVHLPGWERCFGLSRALLCHYLFIARR